MNRVRRQSGFPTFISCQRQDANVLPEGRQSHQGNKLCDVSTVPLVARWPVFLARGSDADGEPHSHQAPRNLLVSFWQVLARKLTRTDTASETTPRCSTRQLVLTCTRLSKRRLKAFWLDIDARHGDTEKSAGRIAF